MRVCLASRRQAKTRVGLGVLRTHFRGKARAPALVYTRHAVLAPKASAAGRGAAAGLNYSIVVHLAGQSPYKNTALTILSWLG